MWTKFAGTVGLLCALPLSVAAADSYLCVSDMVTGFAFNKETKQWEIARFKANEKFVVTRSKGSMFVWEVRRTGLNAPVSYCQEDFTASGYLICKGFDSFFMNRKTLRFLTIYTMGYWDDVFDEKTEIFKEGANTPNMKIGKCTPL
jgi:hypothetical protein